MNQDERQWNKQMAVAMLVGYQTTYEEFRARWNAFSEVIGICFTKYASFAEVKSGDGDEIVFLICGVRGFIRFIHDLKNGYLEYGALLPPAGSDQTRRMPLRKLSFDRVGNVENDYTIHSSEDWSFALLHLRTLAAIMPEIVRAHYAIPASSAEEKALS